MTTTVTGKFVHDASFTDVAEPQLIWRVGLGLGYFYPPARCSGSQTSPTYHSTHLLLSATHLAAS